MSTTTGGLFSSQTTVAIGGVIGSWDASTNTPTIANAVAPTNVGDKYLNTASGTNAVDFGAGSISFDQYDEVSWNGTAWQKDDMTLVASEIPATTVFGSTDVQAALTQAEVEVDANASNLTDHENEAANPHSVTATQVGLGNADDTSDVDKPVSTAQQTALDLKEDLFTNEAISTSTTLSGSRKFLIYDSSGGDLATSLPASPTTGDVFTFIPDDSTDSNNITLSGNGNNINGSSSYVFNEERGSKTILFYGSQWLIIAGYENIFYIENNEIKSRNGLSLNANILVGDSGTAFSATGDDSTGDFDTPEANVEYDTDGWVNSLVTGADITDSGDTVTLISGTGYLTSIPEDLFDDDLGTAWNTLNTTSVVRIQLGTPSLFNLYRHRSWDGSYPGQAHFNAAQVVIEGTNVSGGASGYVTIATIDLTSVRATANTLYDFAVTNSTVYEYVQFTYTNTTQHIIPEIQLNLQTEATTDNYAPAIIAPSPAAQLSTNTLIVKDNVAATVIDTAYNVKYSTNGGSSYSSVLTGAAFKALGLLASSADLRIAIAPIGSQKITTVDINTAQTLVKVVQGGVEVIVNGDTIASILNTGVVKQKGISNSVYEQAHTATTPFDLENGFTQKLDTTVDENTTFEITNENATGEVEEYVFFFTMDGTGGYTLTVGTSFGERMQGSALALDNSANAVNRLYVEVDPDGTVRHSISIISSSGGIQAVSSTGPITGRNKYLVYDTSGGAITSTLPANPIAGDFFTVLPDATNDTNNITLNGNGKNINGAATFVINEERGSKTIFYTGTAWRITAGYENILYIENNEVKVRNALFFSGLKVNAGAGGGVILQDVSGDNTVKTSRIGTEHYDTDEEPFYAIVNVIQSGVNERRLGGGTSAGNAATLHTWYTAANAITLTGTARMSLNNSRFRVNHGLSLKHATKATSATTSNDTIIGVTDNTSARTITLATADVEAGRYITIKDQAGTAGSANPISITGQASQTIDGKTTIRITKNYGWVTLYCNGTNWNIIAEDRKGVSAISATATASLDYSSYIFTGVTASQELDLPAGVRGARFYIKNRSSQTWVLDPNGAEELYSSSAVSTLDVLAGQAYIIEWDGSYWNIM